MAVRKHHREKLNTTQKISPFATRKRNHHTNTQINEEEQHCVSWIIQQQHPSSLSGICGDIMLERIKRHWNRRAAGKSQRRHMRSEIWWFTKICNSQCVSHFAASFIDAWAKTSIAESFVIMQDVSYSMHSHENALGCKHRLHACTHARYMRACMHTCMVGLHAALHACMHACMQPHHPRPYARGYPPL